MNPLFIFAFFFLITHIMLFLGGPFSPSSSYVVAKNTDGAYLGACLELRTPGFASPEVSVYACKHGNTFEILLARLIRVLNTIFSVGRVFRISGAGLHSGWLYICSPVVVLTSCFFSIDSQIPSARLARWVVTSIAPFRNRNAIYRVPRTTMSGNK